MSYFPSQMNGPVITALGNAIIAEFAKTGFISTYLYTLSIATAAENELENIGLIIGYPRPIVPVGFNDENVFILGSIPITTDVQNGLSTVDSEVGGQLISTEASDSGYIDLEIYRRLLAKVAIIKRYGVTIYSIDQICKLVSSGYEIAWNSNNDITITFASTIGYKNVWILTNLFARICTDPQIIIYSGA